MSSQIIQSSIGDNSMPEGEEELQPKLQMLPGIVLFFLIVGMILTLAYKISDPGTLPIRHVSVTGDFIHLSPLKLRDHVSGVVRGGFFDVNVETIHAVLMQEPWIRDVSVNRIWPDKITVNVREQVAVALWGKDGLINSDAEIFYPDPESIPGDLPRVAGPGNTSQSVLNNMWRIEEILPGDLHVRELILSERRSWTLVLDNGLKFRLGKKDSLERIQKFFHVNPINDVQFYEKIQYIDTRYTNGFVIRWKPDLDSDLKNGQEAYGKKI